jgi:hypothetical protein
MLPLRQPSVAHIAFAYDSTFGVVLRHAIGTVPGAVLATDADIGAMTNYPSRSVLRVGIHRAPGHACRFKAVVTAHREIVAKRIRISAAFNLAHTTPENVRRIAVLFITSNNAALAPDALCHIEMKSILLARTGRRR